MFSLARLTLGILVAGLSGCTERQWITYSVNDVPKSVDSRTRHVRLMIGPLRDVRQRIVGNEVLFTSSNETDIGQKTYCINAEEGYKPDSVGTQIAETLATHLRQRGALRAVSVGTRVQEAYYLSGTLRRYYGAQESTSVSPTTGVLTGAVGAAVAAAATPDWTKGIVAIEITDLTLLDESARVVARLPDIRYNRTGRLRASPSCLVVYRNINEHLKSVFGDLAYSIETAVANTERAKGTLDR